MSTKKMLRIEKRSMAQWMILWILLLPLLWGILFEALHIPSAFKYTADIIWVILLGLMVMRQKIIVSKRVLSLVILVLVFFLYSLVSYLLNYQSVIYFLWGMRNNFRFYVFFFAVMMFLQEKNAEKCYQMLDILFWINAPIVLIQYFILGYKQDFLGGIFGTESGVNATTIIFFAVVISRSLLLYMERKESFSLCASKCIVSLVISVLAELKFYFVFFLIMLILSVLLTSFSWRKLLMFFVGAVAVYITSALMVELFGFEGFMSIENIWQLATQKHYSSNDTVNRLSAIPTLSEMLVPEWKNRLFGFGLGNCDTSSFDICNTPFYQMYGYLRYTFFSCAFLFLEVGYVGLFIYVCFFVICGFLIYKGIREERCNKLHGRIALIIAALSLVLVVYNACLRTEAGYIVYFILALPFLDRESDTNNCPVVRE